MNPDNVIALSVALLASVIVLLRHHRYVLRHQQVQRPSHARPSGEPRYPFSARF